MHVNVWAVELVWRPKFRQTNVLGPGHRHITYTKCERGTQHFVADVLGALVWCHNPCTSHTKWNLFSGFFGDAYRRTWIHIIIGHCHESSHTLTSHWHAIESSLITCWHTFVRTIIICSCAPGAFTTQHTRFFSWHTHTLLAVWVFIYYRLYSINDVAALPFHRKIKPIWAETFNQLNAGIKLPSAWAFETLFASRF